MIRKISSKALAFLLFLGPVSAAQAETCRKIDFEGKGYSLCEVAQGQDLRLFLNDAEGRVLGSFQRINESLASEGRELAFAMNAGMYHSDRSPVGLYVENGLEQKSLVTSAGPGNFGMQPNGVFCIRADGRFAVIETLRYARERPSCRFATQSGPMLVIDNALHPRFLSDSTSLYIRNGVGVSADGRRAVFVMSESRVSFHEFGRFFKDALGLPQALYFDGNISRLHAPALRRSDFGFPMGPIVGLITPKE